MKTLACILGGLMVGVLSSCSPSRKDVNADNKQKVFVSIPPQAYFVERIAGERADVEVLVPAGSSPATYEPTPRQMASLSTAKLYFSIGVPFEQGFLPKLQSSKTQTGAMQLEVVNTRKGVPLREMKAHHHEETAEAHAGPGHAGGETAEDDHHGHSGKDPHIWLNPKLVKIQARNIADALIRIDPDGKGTYEANYAAFAADLDALDARLAEALKPVKGKSFLVFHPSWGYFADAYGLRQEPIELEGKEPSAKQLVRIVDTAKAEKIRVVFVQPQFSQSSAQAIADAIDGVVVPIDPLARDYITNLDKVAKIVNETLSKQKQ